MKTETLDDPAAEPTPAPTGQPALILIWSSDRPQTLVLPLAGGAIELGREVLRAAGINDGRTSRRHARIELTKGRFSVTDLHSRNGTFVNGKRIREVSDLQEPVIRIGHTLLLPVDDADLYRPPGITCIDGVVMGPTLRAVHQRIALSARSCAHLLLQGETGSGKELGAETFHMSAARGHPLVAINCATVPKELAERVFFGARRGAYTGAVNDAPGLVQAAASGTLFLDEIGELELEIQAKLLRAIEQKTVMPIGAVSPVAVDFRLCAATHKNLRAAVVEGRFREDLYFRIGRPLVRIPPLRERREEIPWLIESALQAFAAKTSEEPGRPSASAEFVEACLLRAWPGNVRELLAETRIAALAATAAHRASLLASDLDAQAGAALVEDAPTPQADEVAAMPALEEIKAVLHAEQGNIARAAARLGMARSRLRRYIERQGIEVKTLRGT